MGRLLVLLLSLCVFETVFAQLQQQPQQQSPDDCLIKCTNEHYQRSRSQDAMKAIDIGPVKVGNVTAMCPRANDTSKLETACVALHQFKACTDTCPDTPIKKLTLSAFRTQQFVCVDRINDIKKYMPCLAENCPDVQRVCIPKCGSIEASAQKIANMTRRVQGAAPRPPAGPPGSGTAPSTADGHDVDISTITKFIGETCTSFGCFMSCSEAPVTKRCGKDAYLLQRDFMMTSFSSMAQSMSSIGIQTQWPNECKFLLANATLTSATAGPATVARHPPAGAEGAEGTATASAETTVPPKGTADSTAPRRMTPAPAPAHATSPPPSGETRVEKTNATAKDASKKCEKPPCADATAAIPSIVLLVMTILVAFRDI